MPKGPKGGRTFVPLVTREGERHARPQPKRLSAAEKRERKAVDWQLFVKQIGRQAQRHHEPNDRRHNKDDDISLRRMRPDDFDDLIRYGEDD